MQNIDPAVIVALLGAGGLGAFLKDIIEGIWKLRRGVSAKETKRRIDVVQQRDEAIERERVADARADAEAVQRRASDERAFRMRLRLIKAGIDPDEDVVFAQTIQKEPKEPQ